MSDALKRVPRTRYYGSKRNLLPWIYQHIAPLKFETALDVFGGTGSVSMLLRMMGKSVRYHDGFKFNHDVAHALLSSGELPSRYELQDLLDGIVPREGFISETFAGIFYSDEENRWLDGFADAIGARKHSYEIAVLRYLLYQACLKKRPFNLFHRANFALRTNSDVKRSFGNAKTWKTEFSVHMMGAFDELSRLKCSSSLRGNIEISAGFDASKIDDYFDLVYIDPPYISENSSRNRDGYWKKYHFLEGLADYQCWHDRIDSVSPIRMIAEPAWSKEWSSKELFREKLFELIDLHSQSLVVLSYVEDAYPSFDELRAKFSASFENVSIHTLDHHHALSKTRKQELLFVGRPK
ncbi:DNA adenine methylase [Qipengyuania sp. MTN3-11]|uniref:DNA adenine methylase n=1 Tax=Qipengyuania sp. MTN3-11 TaxID=3056557 RepID=UPI0036F42003